MRPKTNPESEKVYECFTCGARFEDAAADTCTACGGALQHIGRSRDL